MTQLSDEAIELGNELIKRGGELKKLGERLIKSKTKPDYDLNIQIEADLELWRTITESNNKKLANYLFGLPVNNEQIKK